MPPLSNSKRTQSTRIEFPRRDRRQPLVTTVRSVGQDNPTSPRARTATRQPASHSVGMRSHPKIPQHPRTDTSSSPKRRTVQLVLWVKPGVKAELQRIAQQEQLSVSATGAAFLEKAVQQNLHSQHTTLLDTVIEKAIGKHMRAYSNRLAVLLVRSVFATEQLRGITTNILSRQEGMNQKELASIITASDNKARGNIARITPQLKTLIEVVQKQLEEGGSSNG